MAAIKKRTAYVARLRYWRAGIWSFPTLSGLTGGAERGAALRGEGAPGLLSRRPPQLDGISEAWSQGCLLSRYVPLVHESGSSSEYG